MKNCYNCKILLLATAYLCSPHLLAAEDIPPPPPAGSKTQDSAPAKAPAPLPPADRPEVESDDSRNLPKPEVNIIHRKDGTIEEYRVDGKLRYVKVIPKKGKPYYLVDHDGDGVLEQRHSDLKGPPPVNQWIIKKW